MPKRRKPAGPPHSNTAVENLKRAYRELAEDKAAGRVSKLDYSIRKQILDGSLAELRRAKKPGELTVIGIPRRKIDWDRFLGGLIAQAMDNVRKKDGQDPMSPEERRSLEADVRLAQQESKKQAPTWRKHRPAS